MEDRTYDLENLPEDAEIFVGQQKEYKPIDPSEMYQVQITKAELKSNPYHQPENPDPSKRGNKYQFSFEFVILNEGEFYGRRLWDNTSPAFKPAADRDATKLYKLISKALNREFDLEECFEYAPDMKTFVKHLGDEIIGKQLRVAIENVTSATTGKVKSKITTYNPVKTVLPQYDLEKVKQMQMEADNTSADTSKKVETKEVKSEDINDISFDDLFPNQDFIEEEKKEEELEDLDNTPSFMKE